jgi:transcriptional regulator with AAA-type ATPase domain/NAD-dependent dihydropyrimidine dehydrogenase PreA subunit
MNYKFDDKVMKKERLDYISILKEIPGFDTLKPEHIKKIASIVKIQEFSYGNFVFREKDAGDAFYVVLSGKVRIFATNKENAEITLSTLGPMDSFGEIGFITGNPREASARIEKDSKLLVINKYVFDVITEHDPSLTRFLINILARRLRADTERAVAKSSREQELKQFWIERDIHESYILKGRSKHIQQLKSFAEKAAENSLPVMLIGEKGTGKLALASYIYEKSRYKQDRFITVDCSAISQDYTGQDGRSQGTSEIILGLLHESALFGHLRGSLTFTNEKRLGYIEVVEGGTIVIENIEELSLSVQNKLLTYLKTGFYKRIGSNERIKSNGRVILTCGIDIEELVKNGHFSKELYNFLIPQSIVLIPLRERKKDIQELVENFIEKYNEIEGKRIMAMTKEAMNLLLAYDWPNNIDELEGVIRRAVNLCDEYALTPAHISLGPISTETTGIGFNLLKFERIRRFILSKLYPNVFKIAMVIVYFLVILLLLSDFNGYAKNTSLLVWAIGWPVIVTSLLLTSRLFCGLCPFYAIAEVVQKILNLRLKLPNFIKRQGPYIGVFGFALILCSEHITDMPNYPLATAVLLLSILGFTVIFYVLYGSASWCRYLCPLGLMNGIYSKLSIIEIRANTSVCYSQCKYPACYKGTEESEGCPMNLGVFNMYTNEDCTLCGQCIKNCKHDAVNLNLRVPAAELVRDSGLNSYREGSTFAIAFFVPMLIAVVLAINLRKLSLYHHFSTNINSEVVHYALICIFFYILCFGLIWLGAIALKKSNSEGSSLERLVWYTCTFIPIAFAGEVSNHVITFINGFGQILPVVNLHFGTYKLGILNQQASTEMVKFLQIMIIITGTVASMFIGKKVVKKIAKTQGWNKVLSIYFVNFVFCGLFIFVFLLRDGLPTVW